MKSAVLALTFTSCMTLLVGCTTTAPDKSNTFTFTADLPKNFAYVATVWYVPAKGQKCDLAKRDNLNPQFNREWRKEYKPDSQIEIRRVSKGCELVIYQIDLEINATYGDDFGDMGRDSAGISVREDLLSMDKGVFNTAGESEFSGQCQWMFRTVGGLRRLTKILDCKTYDQAGKPIPGKPSAAFTLDQLPGNTVRLKINLADEEKPAIRDTWVKVPNGWKRCMGKGFKDPYAFCYGNDKDFSSFMMPDGKNCTIYPGCTENKEGPR